MSAETKWTEGPWRYDKTNGSPTTGQHMIAGSVPGYIAEVRDCGSGDVAANGQLIAAAPELYEALKVARRVIYSGGDWPVGWSIRWLDAALAKARGEQ